MSWDDDLKRDTPRGLTSGADAVPAARWATLTDLRGKPDWDYAATRRKTIFLGYRDGQGVGCADNRHVLMVAGSRAGKGVSVIVPNLLLYEGSVLAIDPKGELARVTARRRAEMGQKLVILDPFNTTGAPSARFNPLAEIDPLSETAVDDAAMLAAALIVDDGGDNHWTNGARQLVVGLILFALMQPPERRTLTTVRGFFQRKGFVDNDGKPQAGYRQGLMAMADAGDAFGGLVAAIGNSFLGKSERELSSLVSTADVQLAFLDSPPLRDCLSRSDFTLADLKTRPTTVYLCLPAGRMATHAKWLRAIIDLSLVMCERVKVIPKPPLLVVLDEFPVLGHMQSIESAAGQIAGFGVKLFTVVQDLTQLQRLYKESWETFIGNAGVTIFFGNADVTTLEYVSKKLGTIGFDIRKTSGAGLEARLGGARVIDEQFQLTKLLEPHEVEMMFARDTRRLLVLSSAIPPLIVERAVYHNHEGGNVVFAGMFDDHVQ